MGIGSIFANPFPTNQPAMEEKREMNETTTENTVGGEQAANEMNAQSESNATETAADNPVEETAEARLERELAEMKDKFLRLQADFENVRKRHARERIELFQNAAGDMMKELLPVLDDFERALAVENDANVHEGMSLIYAKFKRTLDGKGLREMDVLHQSFDPEFHEAITNIPAPEENLKGKVVDVIEKGYYIHDHVLRYAKVVVGQ